MNLGDLVSSFRNQIGEQSTRRFTSAIVTDFANRAQIQVAFEVDFPESTLTITTVANQQEYQLPELIKILRVYMLGPGGTKQQLLPTDIPTLEGDILQQFDNTSSLIQGSPVQSSQFFAQQPEAYPVQNVPLTGRGSGPLPMKSAWGVHARPSWYLRGGYIGVVPPPGTMSPQYTICIDYVPTPPALNVSSDTSLFPSIFKDAIVWQMVAYARFSDNQSAYEKAIMMYQDQMANKVRPWLDHLQAFKPKTFVPRTVRSQFRRRRGDIL